MAIWNPFGKKKTTDSQPVSSPGNAGDNATPSPDANNITSSPSEKHNQGPEAVNAPPAPLENSPVTSAPSQMSTSEPNGKRGIFSGFRQALQKTAKFFNTDIRDLIGKDGRLVDEAFLDELFTFLVKTDMGNRAAIQIRDDVHHKFRARKVHLSELIASAKISIRELMGDDSTGIQLADSGPTVIMVVGVNGSGKTTSIAKLTRRFVSTGNSVVLGAGDTFRAAAVEQLSIWSERLGAKIVTGRHGSDPASVAFKTTETAKNENIDVCIIDTAGRLQTQANLMDELTRIKRVIGKVIPGAPHEVLLVLDATAGQNAISQAKGFSSAAECTGIILAKLDGTAKGGVAIPIRQEFNLPVKFIGLGETPDAFAEFSVNNYIDALFDDLSN